VATLRPALHHRIRTEIEGRILSGEWPPGFRIPVEHELMAVYGCARMTVNKVLSSLVATGLIERRRKAGSFVRRPPEPTALLEIPDIKAQVTARGAAYGYELLSSCERQTEPTDLLPPDARLLDLHCRHLADGVAFALEQRRIMLAVIPSALAADFAEQPPGAWLLSHVAWHEAEHRISAQPADAPIAARLGVEVGHACLVVDRRTWRSEELVTAVRLWYPDHRTELVARFTPLERDDSALTRSRVNALSESPSKSLK
jgi:GntR family histidine utilization transcriptional repressor